MDAPFLLIPYSLSRGQANLQDAYSKLIPSSISPLQLGPPHFTTPLLQSTLCTLPLPSAHTSPNFNPTAAAAKSASLASQVNSQ